MGKTKIALIDDYALKEEIKTKKKAISRKVKPEPVKATGEVDQPSVILANDDEAHPESKQQDSGIVVNTPPTSDKSDKKVQKPGKAKPRSKKYQEISKDLDRSKTYPLSEAIEMAKKLSYSSFKATLEAHINTSQTGIRGLVSLPFASGKKLKIVAFGKGADLSGADVAGSDETIEEINKGKVNFDLLVTTPDWMPKLAKVARILGPRGLMPNPKNGTITDDLKKAVESFQAGKTEYKTESKAAVIHLGLGKLDQPTEQLSANVKTLLQTIGKTRVKKITLSPTMGPGVKVDLASI